MGWPLDACLIFRPMDRAAARSVLSWRYSAPYDFYNPPAALPEHYVAFLADPQNGYYAISGPGDELVAACCFGLDAQVPGGDYSEDALDVGMQLRPDLTGQGYGPDAVQAVLEFGRRTYCPAHFRVTVATFNGRALRVWERAGFKRAEEFCRVPDGLRFVVLLRSA